jgi:hypothetical protein
MNHLGCADYLFLATLMELDQNQGRRTLRKVLFEKGPLRVRLPWLDGPYSLITLLQIYLLTSGRGSWERERRRKEKEKREGKYGRKRQRCTCIYLPTLSSNSNSKTMFAIAC